MVQNRPIYSRVCVLLKHDTARKSRLGVRAGESRFPFFFGEKKVGQLGCFSAGVPLKSTLHPAIFWEMVKFVDLGVLYFSLVLPREPMGSLRP